MIQFPDTVNQQYFQKPAVRRKPVSATMSYQKVSFNISYSPFLLANQSLAESSALW
jgi:hypothetical protein